MPDDTMGLTAPELACRIDLHHSERVKRRARLLNAALDEAAARGLKITLEIGQSGGIDVASILTPDRFG